MFVVVGDALMFIVVRAIHAFVLAIETPFETFWIGLMTVIVVNFFAFLTRLVLIIWLDVGPLMTIAEWVYRSTEHLFVLDIFSTRLGSFYDWIIYCKFSVNSN
jgi:hypothetical protein